MKIILYTFITAALLCTGCCQSSEKNVPPLKIGENPVIETIMARRSIRKYQSRPIEDEKIHKILECGINAPTGMYKQSWQIRVVQDPEFLAKLDQKYYYGAPCLIFIAYDRNYDLSQVDCGLLGENMILAAQSMGLGTCCLGQIARFIMSEDGEELFRHLDIPETHELLFAIAVGYTDQCPEAKPRDMGRVKFI